MDIYIGMKKSIEEQLIRIHTLTYGDSKVINEDFINKILTKVGIKKDSDKKLDDPKKADLVSDDVNEFYNTLEQAIKSGGLTQQSKGNINYQKSVESMQIGLVILGYQLPKYGVDGLFGSETASAVNKFTKENLGKVVSEAKLLDRYDKIVGKPGQGTHNASDWASRNAWDVTGEVGDKVYSISSGTVNKVRKGSGKLIKQGNKKIYGDQISINSNDGKPNVFYTHLETNFQPGDSVKEGDVIGTLIPMGGIPTHVHIGLESGDLATYVPDLPSATGGSSGGRQNEMITTATPEMLNRLIQLLKNKGIKSEDIKKHIDSVTTGGSAEFTDLDLNTEIGKKIYSEICQKFIDSRQPNLLGITGKMMTIGAERAFKQASKYVPPELALAQLAVEGGIGNKDPNSRPIRTKNPFNVGNTDSGANVQHGDVQSGINTYYSLIARNYLGKGRTASDLVQNFVNNNGNRYASSKKYERDLNIVASQANRIAQPIVASMKNKTGSEYA